MKKQTPLFSTALSAQVTQATLATLCLASLASAQSATDPAPASAWARDLGGIEVQYGVQARVMANGANFGFHPSAISADQPSSSFANTRLRGWVDLGKIEPGGYGFYSQFEFGHLAYGSGGDFPKRTVNGGDASGIELRRGFLWLMPDEDTLIKVGVQGWNDMFTERPAFDYKNDLQAVDAYDTTQALLANSVWDFNVAGVNLAGRTLDHAHYRLGVFLLGEGDSTFTGDGGALLLAGDLDLIDGDRIWGASLYYLRDNGDYSYGTFGGPLAAYDSSEDWWVGVRGHLGSDDWDPSVALIYNQGGTEGPDWDHAGWAARASARGAVGSGEVALLAAVSTGNDGSGDSGEFRTLAQSARDNFGGQGYWSMLPLSSPSGPSDVNDLGVSLQNQGLGLLTVQAAWIQALNDAVTSHLVAGWLQAAEDHPVSGAADMGVELAAILDWGLRPGLGVQFGAAYMLTGDFYSPGAGVDPDDLYELFFRFQFEF